MNIWGPKRTGRNGVMDVDDVVAFVESKVGGGSKEWTKNVRKAAAADSERSIRSIREGAIRPPSSLPQPGIAVTAAASRMQGNPCRRTLAMAISNHLPVFAVTGTGARSAIRTNSAAAVQKVRPVMQ